MQRSRLLATGFLLGCLQFLDGVVESLRPGEAFVAGFRHAAVEVGEVVAGVAGGLERL